MIQNVLRNLGGVGIYGVVSVCLFFTVFTIAMVWAFAQKKSFLNAMSSVPLDDEGNSSPSRPTGGEGEQAERIPHE